MTDSKLISLTEDTTPDSTDYMYGVDSTGTTDKRYSIANLMTAFAAGAAFTGAFVKIKRAVYSGGGVITTTSTTRTPIDATNLPYQSLTLAVGDMVECELACGARNLTAAELTCFDFEVDQPTSANLYIGTGLDSGIVAAYNASTANFMTPVTAKGTFIATEAGVHQFRPVWFVTAGTGALFTAASSSYDQLATFLVKKWPAAALA